MVKIPPGYYIRTLVDPIKGLFVDFDSNLFCDRAADDSLFMSKHVVWKTDDLWIGEVCRDMPGDLWQIYLIDLEKPRGAWEDFQEALDQLFKWSAQHEEYKRSTAYQSELKNLKPQDIEPAHQPQTKPKKRRSTRKKSA